MSKNNPRCSNCNSLIFIKRKHFISDWLPAMLHACSKDCEDQIHDKTYGSYPDCLKHYCKLHNK